MANTMASPSTTTTINNSERECCLSEKINTSTRSTHTKLNRTIIAGLPFALPPYSATPSIYTFGLLHIAPIYITFESLWNRILDDPDGIQVDMLPKSLGSRDNTYPAKPCDRIRVILSNLRLLDLQRSHQLRTDILNLSGNGKQEIEEQLDKAICEQRTILNFTSHIRKSVNEKPHVLLAYAWVLYMALFSGGRYLSSSLQKAGPQFWTRGQDVPASASVERGLDFFHFVGGQEGEDIKKEFKNRFATAETFLSDLEKDDIIDEAQQIFTFMLELVDELTQVCASVRCNAEHTEGNVGTAAVCDRVICLAGIQGTLTGEDTHFKSKHACKADPPPVRVSASRAARFFATVSVFIVPRTLFKSALRPVGAWRFYIQGVDFAVACLLVFLNLAFMVWYFGSSETWV